MNCRVKGMTNKITRDTGLWNRIFWLLINLMSGFLTQMFHKQGEKVVEKDIRINGSCFCSLSRYSTIFRLPKLMFLDSRKVKPSERREATRIGHFIGNNLVIRPSFQVWLLHFSSHILSFLFTSLFLSYTFVSVHFTFRPISLCDILFHVLTLSYMSSQSDSFLTIIFLSNTILSCIYLSIRMMVWENQWFASSIN